MAMTLKLNVSFPMTIVVKTETIKAFEETREEARETPVEEIEKLKGENRFRADLFRGDKTTEEVMKLIYRAGIRELINKELKAEICGNESTARLGCVTVRYEPTKARSCQGCVRTECSRPEGKVNAGCVDKQTGVRSAHFEQRFEVTQ